MKKLLTILAVTAAAFVAAPEASAHPGPGKHAHARHHCEPYVANHARCGCPIYKQRFVARYTHWGDPVYRVRRLPFQHRRHCHQHPHARHHHHHHDHGYRDRRPVAGPPRVIERRIERALSRIFD